jgi:hypothetical protein
LKYIVICHYQVTYRFPESLNFDSCCLQWTLGLFVKENPADLSKGDDLQRLFFLGKRLVRSNSPPLVERDRRVGGAPILVVAVEVTNA